jgi:DNA polymerase
MKDKEYKALVEERKICTLCKDLRNPSDVNPDYDSDEIGMWSLWQGDLNAKIMVVGQDWSDIKTYNNWKGRDKDTNATNTNLIELLSIIGYNIKSPETSNTKNNGLFFTNAVLCLKKGGMQAEVDDDSYKKCMTTFLKPLIELIKPNLIISLGYKAYLGVTSLYGVKQQEDMKSAVRTLISLNKDTKLYAVYHCGKKSINMNRHWEDMKKDWNLLKVQLDGNF